mgnify:CR=1 FL=1
MRKKNLQYIMLLLKHRIIPIRNLIVDCKILTDKYTAESNVHSKVMDLNNIGTYEILNKMTPYQQFESFRSRLKGELIGTKYHKYLCPFHDEHNTPSLVLYHMGATSPTAKPTGNKNLYIYETKKVLLISQNKQMFNLIKEIIKEV